MKAKPALENAPGFTLTELLAVLFISALAAAMLMPALSGAREQARENLCVSNLAKCGSALLAYSQDYDGWLMPNNTYHWGYRGGENRWGSMLVAMGYLEVDSLSEAHVLRCPDMDYNPGRQNETYGMRSTANLELDPSTRFVRIKDFEDPSRMLWLADSYSSRSEGQINWFCGGFNLWGTVSAARMVHARHNQFYANAWFMDGRVETCSPPDLKKYGGSRAFAFDGTPFSL